MEGFDLSRVTSWIRQIVKADLYWTGRQCHHRHLQQTVLYPSRCSSGRSVINFTVQCCDGMYIQVPQDQVESVQRGFGNGARPTPYKPANCRRRAPHGRQQEKMQRMLEDLSTESAKHGLRLHPDKSKVITNFHGSGNLKVLNMSIEILGTHATLKYLGRKLCM